ncbi:MAG: hypothetical protein ACOYM2_20345, partial [Rectinemataceae bacterium]
GRIAEAEQSRLLAGRELKALGEPVPAEACDAVSIGDLLAERKRIEEWNAEQDRRVAAIRIAAKGVRDKMVSALTARDFGTFDELSSLVDTMVAEFRAGVPLAMGKLALPEQKLDVSEVEDRMANAEATNAKARKYAEFLEKRGKKEAKKQEYDGFDKSVTDLRQERIDMVKAAKLPAEGLEITETGLSHHGVNDENWSDSEALKIALMLAVAFTGELRTVYIKRGEALDAASLAKVKAFAEAEDFQVIMEIVDDSYEGTDDGVVWIDEGQILPVRDIAGQHVAERAGDGS